MPLAFRNVDAEPSDAVSTWPTEAVQTALERGDLEHWRWIAVEIGRHPWGRTARQVEEILGHSRPYGVANLMESVIARARERTVVQERDAVAGEIRNAIAQSGMSRAELASLLGTSASRLSTYASGKVTPSAAFMVRLRRELADR